MLASLHIWRYTKHIESERASTWIIDKFHSGFFHVLFVPIPWFCIPTAQSVFSIGMCEFSFGYTLCHFIMGEHTDCTIHKYMHIQFTQMCAMHNLKPCYGLRLKMQIFVLSPLLGRRIQPFCSPNRTSDRYHHTTSHRNN